MSCLACHHRATTEPQSARHSSRLAPSKIWLVCGLLLAIHFVSAVSASGESILRISDHEELILSRQNTSRLSTRQSLENKCGAHRRRRRQRIDRISGGYEANDGEFPSYVQLLIEDVKGKQYACGGVIVSEWVVVTAKHCVGNINKVVRSVRILVGSTKRSSGTKYLAAKRCLLEGFGSNYDFAVLIMESPIRFNELVQPACLPSFDLDPQTQAYLVGFGLTHKGKQPEGLQVLPLTRRVCRNAVPPAQSNEMCLVASDWGHLGDACRGKWLHIQFFQLEIRKDLNLSFFTDKKLRQSRR